MKRLAMFALAITTVLLGCAATTSESPESEAQFELHATGESLQGLGVHYIKATGTEQDGNITFFDNGTKVIGGAVLKGTSEAAHEEINWKGSVWELALQNDVETIKKDGFELNPQALPDALQKELDEAKSVVEEAADEANFSSTEATAQACKKTGGICKVFWIGKGKCCKGYKCSNRSGAYVHCVKK